MRIRRQPLLLCCAAALLLLGCGAFLAARRRVPDIPTAEVKQKEFIDYLQVRGQLRARKSTTITAPFGAGDLQILTIVRSGATVQKGDVVVQFDVSNTKSTFDQGQSRLRAVEAEIQQAAARAHMNEEQRKTDMLAAQYNVERARLDARKQEILSEIEAEKTKLVLADQEQKLDETRIKVISSEEGGRADTEAVRLRRSKAAYDVRRSEQQLQALTLHAPVTGVVRLLQNYRASNSDNAPEFKPGDRVWSGAELAEIPEAGMLRVIVRVDEIDRGPLRLNQAASVYVDAVPDREFPAHIAEISTLGKPDFTSSWPPPRNFDVILEIQDNDTRLRPGLSANARIVLNRIPNAVVVPPEALFERNGRTVVYVTRGSGFEQRAVVVGSRAKSECLISSGLRPGERVALRDPAVEAQGNQ